MISLGKATLPSNTKPKKTSKNKTKMEFLNIHGDGKKVTTFQSK
jgi:hypothetical protein